MPVVPWHSALSRMPHVSGARVAQSCAVSSASDADVQLAVLIASAFSMYNRMVDGFRAVTPPSAEAYRERAAEIAEHGYSAPAPVTAGSTRS